MVLAVEVSPKEATLELSDSAGPTLMASVDDSGFEDKSLDASLRAGGFVSSRTPETRRSCRCWALKAFLSFFVSFVGSVCSTFSATMSGLSFFTGTGGSTETVDARERFFPARGVGGSDSMSLGV